MNEQEKHDKKLRKVRDLWIGVALFAVAGIILFGLVSEGKDKQATGFSVLGLVAGILALRAGMKLGEHRSHATFARDDRAVSPVIAVILMVAITVVLASVVFVLVSDIGANPPPPSIGFTVDSVADTLTVSSVSSNTLTWGELAVTGCTAPTDGNETVDAGDELTGCTGNVKVIHKPSNTMVYTARFD